MALIAKERQGYLDDLTTKSRPELQELLQRQQKLLDNVPFISKLPDRGVKICAMSERIQAAITQLEAIDDTADLLQRMDIQSDQSRRSRGGATDVDPEEEELLRQLATRGQQEAVITDERNPVADAPKFINSYEKVIRKAEKRNNKLKFRPNRTVRTTDVQGLSEQMSDVSLRPSQDVVMPDQLSEVSLRPLRDVVMLEPDTLNEGRHADGTANGQGEGDHTVGMASHKHESPMELPSNRLHGDNEETSKGGTDLTKNEPSLSTESSTENLNSATNCNETRKSSVKHVNTSRRMPQADHAEAHGKLKYNYDELLQTSLYTKPRHSGVQIISIEESAALQTSQQRTVQELQATAAAEKLSGRLHIRMETFKPEGRTNAMSSYRDKTVESDNDMDSDDEEVDYPE